MTDTRITHQIATNPVEATLAEEDGRWTLTMRRHLRHSPDRVWRMLTEPERLSRWSPFVPDRVLDSVGPATARENVGDQPHDAEVLVLDPPRELKHRWGGDLMRWTLSPGDDGGTRLTLQHAFAERNDAGKYGAGWHICLATLAAAEDEDVARVVGKDALVYDWERLRAEYDALLAR